MDGLSFFDAIMSQLDASREFGRGLEFISVVGLFVVLMTPFSGILLYLEMKAGVALSLIQLPFKIALVIPPSFYFLGMLGIGEVFGGVFLALVIIVLEIFKSIILALCFKNSKRECS